mgnify:CR=1 FL=1
MILENNVLKIEKHEREYAVVRFLAELMLGRNLRQVVTIIDVIRLFFLHERPDMLNLIFSQKEEDEDEIQKILDTYDGKSDGPSDVRAAVFCKAVNSHAVKEFPDITSFGIYIDHDVAPGLATEDGVLFVLIAPESSQHQVPELLKKLECNNGIALEKLDPQPVEVADVVEKAREETGLYRGSHVH